MTTQRERWLPIPGWEGWYSASDLGRIRSEERTVLTVNGQFRTYRSKILSQAIEFDTGRCQVRLHRAGHSRLYRVHQLVLMAFVGECPEGMEACHWDDNSTNNTLDNLRWDTSLANKQDMARNGRGNQNWRKTRCVRGHEFTPENTYRRGDGGRDCRACWTLRPSSYKPKGNRHQDRTHCPRNHEYTPENTYAYPTKGGGVHRSCRRCALDRAKHQKAS